MGIAGDCGGEHRKAMTTIAFVDRGEGVERGRDSWYGGIASEPQCQSTGAYMRQPVVQTVDGGYGRVSHESGPLLCSLIVMSGPNSSAVDERATEVTKDVEQAAPNR